MPAPACSGLRTPEAWRVAPVCAGRLWRFMFGAAVYFEGVACVAHGSRWVSDLRRGGGGGGGYAAVWHERDPRGGGTLTRCATGDVRVLPRVCVFACGFSKILAQPCLSSGFARRVVCVCACVCAVSLCTCRAFLLVASSPPVPPNDAICDFYCPYRAFVTAHEEAAH